MEQTPSEQASGVREGGVVFSILGPLDVSGGDGSAIAISSPQQRTILAALLIEPNAVVASEALVDALWPTSPPASAANAVQVNVSKLRAMLEPERERQAGESGMISTRPGGYLLEVAPQQLDALRFERLVAAGRLALPHDPRRARGCLGDALSLWRGRPLAELGAELFFAPWAARIEELQLSALETWVDARLALGEHDELVVELAKLVAEHPLRERLRAQQMLALYRCGRTPEALDAYRSARGALLDQLGLEPGPELARLERAILRQDPDLALRPAPRPPASAGSGDGERPHPVVFACLLRPPAATAARRTLGDWEIGLALEAGGGGLLQVDEGRVVVAFEDPISLVGASVAAAGDRERPAQVGVHAGATVVGGHYPGVAPERAHRLARLAHPGQILVSQAASELLGGSAEACELRKLGAPSLADLGRPESLYQLADDRLQDDFPRLRSLDDAPNNLPVYGSSFVGRARESAEIARLLERTRVLTLTGPGGCGKTRLAMHAAADLMPAFDDGVFAVELAPLSDPAHVPGAVAAALGLPQNPRLPMIDVIARHLGEGRVLLVLDTCEHLTSACAEAVEALTTSCPELRVLATSRERLGADGEAVWAVPPLSLPDSFAHESVFETDSVRLLIERVAALRPDFRLELDAGDAPERICRRLAGLPLAIEFVAARVPALGLEQIADRLEAKAGEGSGMKLLRGARGAVDRHGSMELALDWSYELLDEEERTLLTRLSVFTGGFTMEDAELVAGDDEMDEPDIEEVLDGLVERSMALAEDAGEGRFRYRLLDPVRDYAAAKLAERNETENLRRRHAERYLALAVEIDSGLHGSDERKWLDRFEDAHDNLRAAMGWAIEQRDAELALGLTGVMWWFWYTRGYLAEGREWLERALALPAESAARMSSLIGSAHLAFWQGDHAHTAARDGEVLAASDSGEPEFRRARAWASMGLGCVAVLVHGDVDRAIALEEESESLFRELGSAWELGYAVATLAACRLYRGENELAADGFDEAIQIQRAIGENLGLASALRWRGLAAGLLGEPARGTALCEQALALASRHEDRSGEASALNFLATIARYEGDLDRARPLFAEALALAAEIGESLDVRAALDGLAGFACHADQLERATSLLAKAELIGTLTGFRAPPAERAAHDADVATAREGLSARDFEAAWAAGEAMGPEEIVAVASGIANLDETVAQT